MSETYKLTDAERRVTRIQKIVCAIRAIRAKYKIPPDKKLDVSVKTPQKRRRKDAE